MGQGKLDASADAAVVARAPMSRCLRRMSQALSKRELRVCGAGLTSLVTLGAVLAAVLCAAAFASSARAAGFYSLGPVYSNGADGTVVHQQRVAVEHATGNVLVANVVSDQIDVYAPTESGAALLTSFGAGELSDPFGIAVDQDTGAVYVSDAGNSRIARYISDGAATPTYTFDGSFTSPVQGDDPGEVGSFAAALVIDGASDRLLVADPGNNRVQRFTLAGAYDSLAFDGADAPLVDPGDADGHFTGLLDLAVDSTGDIVVIDSTGDIADGAGSSRVLRFSSAGVYEGQIGGSLSRPATVGIRPFNDDVVVSFNQDAVLSGSAPQLTAFSSAGDPLGAVALSGVDYSVVTGIAIDDGTAGRMYVSSDGARSFLYGGSAGTWSLQVYAQPTPPTVSDEAASSIAQTGARLGARVVTNGADTHYRFAYGIVGQGFTQSTPDRVLSQALGAQSISTDAVGLQPDTEYQFRLVLDNGIGGPVTGSGATFRTYPLAPSARVTGVSNVTADAATLQAEIDTHGFAGQYSFAVDEVGGVDHHETARADLPATNGPTVVSARVTGLMANKTYTVSVYAHAKGGATVGDPGTLATLPTSTPPARQAEPLSPGANAYGCGAPRLTGAAGKITRGSIVTLNGTDLGVFGTVTFNDTPAEVRSYTTDRVSVVVPRAVTGTAQVRVDCGTTTAPLAVAIAASVKPKKQKCKKGYVMKKVKGKTRCVKKPKAKAKSKAKGKAKSGRIS